MPAWEKFEAPVKVLGAGHDHDWRALHGAALAADRQRKASRRRSDGRTKHGHTPQAADPSPNASEGRAGQNESLGSHGMPGTAAGPAPAPRGVEVLPGASGSEGTRGDGGPASGQGHLSVSVTRLPEICATIKHTADPRTTIFLAACVLVVIATIAVLLSELGQRRPAALVPANQTEAQPAQPARPAESTTGHARVATAEQDPAAQASSTADGCAEGALSGDSIATETATSWRTSYIGVNAPKWSRWTTRTPHLSGAVRVPSYPLITRSPSW